MTHDVRAQLSVEAEKAILVRVEFPDSKSDPADPLGELASLADTAGAKVVAKITQARKSVDAATYVGQGKVAEIARLVAAHDADVVIFDHDLSPNQLREVEKVCQCKILDRSELILDIFATRARSREAQLQVALAQLEYTYPRLRHMWSHLERITGGAGVGARGPGEMQLEIDRRLVRDKVSDYKRKLAEIQNRKTREVETRKAEHFTIGLVGYTNAGKSTLFNTLTGAGTLAEDKLFATLDTKTRRWGLGGAHYALLSDTVGFIRDLPHHLVASFKATLEEATHADLMLVLLDIAHPQAIQQLQAVQQVLTDISCGQHPALLLLNKTDAVANADDLAFWRSVCPEALPISARTGAGLDHLAEVVRDQMLGRMQRARIRIPLLDSKGVTFAEKFSTVCARDYEVAPGMVELDVEISTRILGQLPNHAHHAEILSAIPSRTHAHWRCRTVPVSEMIPPTLVMPATPAGPAPKA